MFWVSVRKVFAKNSDVRFEIDVIKALILLAIYNLSDFKLRLNSMDEFSLGEMPYLDNLV